MNAKKIARRQRALERFSIMNYDQAREAKEKFEVDYTIEQYQEYVLRKKTEFQALGGVNK